MAVQALPGSRLNTTILKEWLLQHLASLHSYQAHVAAAEAASRQKQHAAAAAAAVRAVQRSLQAHFRNEEEEEDNSTPREFLAAETDSSRMLFAQDGAEGPGKVGLPAQLVDAAAGAANMMAAGAVHAQFKSQVRFAWRHAVCTPFDLHKFDTCAAVRFAATACILTLRC